MKKTVHPFLEDIALEYGYFEAILIPHFQYWITINRSNGINFHNKHHWTYNSVREIQEKFPFFSIKQINRVIKSLVTKGVLITGNFHNNPFSHSKWYAFKKEEVWLNPSLFPFSLKGKSMYPSDPIVFVTGEKRLVENGVNRSTVNGQIDASQNGQSLLNNRTNYILSTGGGGEKSTATAVSRNKKKKEEEKIAAAAAETDAPSLPAQRKALKDEIKAWQTQNPGEYPTPLIEQFFQYWGEENETGVIRRNRYTFFDVGGRLANFWRRCGDNEKDRLWAEHHRRFKKNR